ncbi:MAG: hypothetical protein RL144_242 [Actinomycetota bacterium]|jgi:cytochrome c oxidase subunit 2
MRFSPLTTRLRGLLLAAPVLLLTSCSKVSGLGLEEGVTSVNDQTVPLWQGAWIAGGVVGVITLILILWPAVFHRGKKDGPEFPKQTQYNIPVEVAYTVIPFIIVAVLFFYTVQKQNVITNTTGSYSHEISINAFQWSWQFEYPEAGPEAVVTGTTGQPPTLVVPIGESVRYTLNANDVVHAFYVPSFAFQMQALPGVTNYFQFTASKLGEYRGYCNILCGRSHTYMRFNVKVVTLAEYNAYLETLKGSPA